jgi:ATP-dependent DNA helicase PIF1
VRRVIAILKFTRSARDATARTAIENRLANYHVAKYQPAKALQRHAACSKKLMSNVVEATILIGTFKGENVLISRITMIPTDTPFQFQRLQFPIGLALAITINKAQGQSYELCGLDLHTDCFSHACSRVGKPSTVKLNILETCAFSFLSFPFNQTEPQQSVAG